VPVLCASKTNLETFKNLEEKTNLKPLDLIHSNLCEINGLSPIII
jgi:hypothetical protein